MNARIAFSGDSKRFLERTAKIQAGLLICVYCLSYAPALLTLNLPPEEHQAARPAEPPPPAEAAADVEPEQHPLPAGLEPLNPALAVTEKLPEEATKDRNRRGFWWWGPWYEHENLRDERAEAFTGLIGSFANTREVTPLIARVAFAAQVGGG